MIPKNETRITESAVEKAYSLGLDASDHEYGLYGVLLDMLEQSAVITHPRGNRRYEDWVLSFSRGVLHNVHLIRCGECDDKRRVQVWNECPDCHGKGCEACRGKGRIIGYIPCQKCCT